MNGNRPLSEIELNGIEWHTQKLIDAANARLTTLQSIPRVNRPEHIRNEISYWQHARKALQWSIHVARQRKRKGPPNVA